MLKTYKNIWFQIKDQLKLNFIGIFDIFRSAINRSEDFSSFWLIKMCVCKICYVSSPCCIAQSWRKHPDISLGKRGLKRVASYGAGAVVFPEGKNKHLRIAHWSLHCFRSRSYCVIWTASCQTRWKWGNFRKIQRCWWTSCTGESI